jgi:hypothetical protein
MASINGFPVDDSPSALGVRPFQVPGTKVTVPVRADVAPLLLGFAAEFHRSVEPLVVGWNWGYAYRPVIGGRSPSFHAAGIAIDLNAPRHPLGRRHTFTPDQADRIRVLARKYGLRWGGDYQRRPDEMHVEVIVPAARAREMVKALQAPPPLPSAPGSPVLRRGSSGKKVQEVQNALRVAGIPVVKDGVFGPATETAVKQFQRSRGLTSDGVVGRRTWAALRKAVHG